MSLDCPVACSNLSSLPEVVGDAAMLFEPSDRDAIRSALESVLSSPSAAAALKERVESARSSFLAELRRKHPEYLSASSGFLDAPTRVGAADRADSYLRPWKIHCRRANRIFLLAFDQ